jgi:hypothetical protein
MSNFNDTVSTPELTEKFQITVISADITHHYYKLKKKNYEISLSKSSGGTFTTSSRRYGYHRTLLPSNLSSPSGVFHHFVASKLTVHPS